VQEASQATCCPAGPPPAPGEPVSLQQKLINTATSALQTFHPLNKICQHVCAFHCYAHDTTRQVCGLADSNGHVVQAVQQQFEEVNLTFACTATECHVSAAACCASYLLELMPAGACTPLLQPPQRGDAAVHHLRLRRGTPHGLLLQRRTCVGCWRLQQLKHASSHSRGA
jgi:hypothetical protein